MAKIKLTSKKSKKSSVAAKKNVKELTAIAELEDEKLATSFAQIENPSLDQEKRQAFAKLSLTKRKSYSSSDEQENANNNNNNETNDNDKNQGDKIDNNKASAELTNHQSKDKPKIRKARSRATVTSKQIKLTDMTNIVNQSKIHFDPQTNSTMVFEHFIDSTNTVEINSKQQQLKESDQIVNSKKDNNNNSNENHNLEKTKEKRTSGRRLQAKNKEETDEAKENSPQIKRTSSRASRRKINSKEVDLPKGENKEEEVTHTESVERKGKYQRKTRNQISAKTKNGNINKNKENESPNVIEMFNTNKQNSKISAENSRRNSKHTHDEKKSNEAHTSKQNSKISAESSNMNSSKHSHDINEANEIRPNEAHSSNSNLDQLEPNNDNNNRETPTKQKQKIYVTTTTTPTAVPTAHEIDIEEEDTTAANLNKNNTSTPQQNTNKSHEDNGPKTHKFFHRNKSNKSDNESGPEVVSNKMAATRNSRTIKKAPQRGVRSSQVRREQVYEFLSQSQTSDSDGGAGTSGRFVKPADPTGDIIKKLIKEGKVAVAKNVKGKPRLVRKPKTIQNKVMFKAKQKAATGKQKSTAKTTTVTVGNKNAGHTVPTNSKNPKRQPIVNNQYENDDNVDNFDNHFLDDDDDIGNADLDVDYNMNKSPSNHQQTPPAAVPSEHQEGTFSNLAKSVLINQAGRMSADAQKIKAQRLLAMAKKIISTPKNVKTPPLQEPGLHADFSPIPWPNKRPATKASPWRIDEDVNLPRVFNFSRSTGNLPSFSSDYIPPTPRKETPKNRSSIPDLQETTPTIGPPPMEQQEQLNSPLPQIPLQHSASSTPLPQNNGSIPSSFSSNDSNAENQPPPKAATGDKQNQNENDDIFNLKQLPNPRRALTYRSPLKAINILEVVHLPPLQKSLLEKSQNQDMLGIEKLPSSDGHVFKTPQKPTTTTNKKKKKHNSPERDLFGFEEFLSQHDVSSQESDCETPINQKTQHDKSMSTNTNTSANIHNKLTNLRKLRPDGCLDTSLQQQQVENNKGNKKMPNLFNEPGREHNKNGGQKSIKQMLCSTMIDDHRPSTSKRALEELRLRNLPPKAAAGFNCATNFDSNISELFKDPEPETTFNEDEAHRTYIRPYKRKRRLRENKLVFVLDSDESEDESNSDYNNSKSPQKSKKRGHHHHHNSNETDTSSEQQKPAKRKRKCKENPELKTFVDEFQEMCKEVESFQIIVEKSA